MPCKMNTDGPKGYGEGPRRSIVDFVQAVFRSRQRPTEIHLPEADRGDYEAIKTVLEKFYYQDGTRIRIAKNWDISTRARKLRQKFEEDLSESEQIEILEQYVKG